MPFYKELNAATTEGKRTLERLILLREHLKATVPKKTAEESLLLATWNIREFDSPAYGDRLTEAMFYIAEIISHFDLVAIQEVRKDLKALNRLLSILGSNWKAAFSDVTEGSQGNHERMAFVFDARKVKLGGLMGELVIPPLETKGPDGKTMYQPLTQIVRSPLMCGFKVGWTDFVLVTVHILYGKDGANSQERVEEIQKIAQFLAKRCQDPYEWSRNLILLGDFNIFSPTDDTFKAITDAGFIIPPELQQLPSNIKQDKFYDQIAFQSRTGKFGTTEKAGIFNYYQTVFRPEDEPLYAEAMGTSYHTTSAGLPRKNPATYYQQYWRTYQMSDHLPMWVELKVDYSDAYLAGKLAH